MLVAIMIFFIVCVIGTTIYYKKITTKKNLELISTVTNVNRGTISEKHLILQLLKLGFSPKAIFHDLYINRKDGNKSQIDVILATKVGIIVFEVKDYSGWIFGTGGQSQWVQVLAYGHEKYRFYNPIKQNNSHIEALKYFLQENVPFYNVIVFSGDSTLKNISYIPKNAYVTKDYRVKEVLDVILNTGNEAKYRNKHDVVEKLRQAVSIENKENTESDHIRQINDILGTDRIFD